MVLFNMQDSPWKRNSLRDAVTAYAMQIEIVQKGISTRRLQNTSEVGGDVTRGICVCGGGVHQEGEDATSCVSNS